MSAEVPAQNNLSLSYISQIVLGWPLNKTLATSDWDQRPLSDSQGYYAALDAYTAWECLDWILERVHPRKAQRQALLGLAVAQ